MEYWSIGVLQHWCKGAVEDDAIELMKINRLYIYCRAVAASLYRCFRFSRYIHQEQKSSLIPKLHYSNTPWNINLNRPNYSEFLQKHYSHTGAKTSWSAGSEP